MRIIENSPERLLLVSQSVWAPAFFAVFALGMLTMAWFARAHAPVIALGLLGIGAALVLGMLGTWRTETAEFARVTRTATITIRSGFGTKADTVPLAAIRQAVAIRGRRNAHMTGALANTDGRPSLELRRSAPTVPLTKAYLGQPAATEIVDAVNAWLADTARK
jgi:hypothetical protein